MTLPADVYRLYEGLPRQGPGSDDMTREALRRLGALPSPPRILDLACGSGQQTLVLARELQAPVVAIDVHEPFLHDLRRRAAAASLAHLVETRCADMGSLEVPDGSVDLIWCEGAIYIVGFESGLRTWRPWLAQGGKVAVTECSWLVDSPPREARAFWEAEYPAIASIRENGERARRAGFDVIDSFALPASAWWDYYRPILARAERLEPEAATNPILAHTIAEMRREVDLFRQFGDTYGYVFYLLGRS